MTTPSEFGRCTAICGLINHRIASKNGYSACISSLALISLAGSTGRPPGTPCCSGILTLCSDTISLPWLVRSKLKRLGQSKCGILTSPPPIPVRIDVETAPRSQAPEPMPPEPVANASTAVSLVIPNPTAGGNIQKRNQHTVGPTIKPKPLPQKRLNQTQWSPKQRSYCQQQ